MRILATSFDDGGSLVLGRFYQTLSAKRRVSRSPAFAPTRRSGLPTGLGLDAEAGGDGSRSHGVVAGEHDRGNAAP
jgi:hypothetical protein